MTSARISQPCCDIFEGDPPFTLLDFGCGPGRDLKTLADRGHLAIGLDGAARFTAMARAHSGCEVWHQDFIKLDLPDGPFRRYLRQCNPISCTGPGAAARMAGTRDVMGPFTIGMLGRDTCPPRAWSN
jgi:SAM-dependent methyltransferase